MTLFVWQSCVPGAKGVGGHLQLMSSITSSIGYDAGGLVGLEVMTPDKIPVDAGCRPVIKIIRPRT